MRRIVLIIIFMAICGMVNAQSNRVKAHRTAQVSAVVVAEEKNHDKSSGNMQKAGVAGETGRPCACSSLKCTQEKDGKVCGGEMEFKFDAFRRYSTTEKCPYCNGKGCSICDQTGMKYLRTDSGCKCKKCGHIIEQPNDC